MGSNHLLALCALDGTSKEIAAAHLAWADPTFGSPGKAFKPTAACRLCFPRFSTPFCRLFWSLCWNITTARLWKLAYANMPTRRLRHSTAERPG